MSVDNADVHWFVDLSWLEQHNRSFLTLAKGALCPQCRKRLQEGEIAATDLISNIGNCCSKTPEFIPDSLPVLESIFRIFLSNGNKPLGLEGLGDKLKELHDGSAYRTSVEMLPRLLNSGQFYGLRPMSK